METSETKSMQRSSEDILNDIQYLRTTLTDVVANGKAVAQQIKELELKKQALRARYDTLKFNISVLELEHTEALVRESSQKDEQKYSALVLPYIEAYNNIKPYLKMQALPFQEEDLIQMFGYHAEGKPGVLNASDTGTGKTFETTVLIMVLIELNRLRAERDRNE